MVGILRAHKSRAQDDRVVGIGGLREGPLSSLGRAPDGSGKCSKMGDFHWGRRKIVDFACVGKGVDRRVNLCHWAWLTA